VQGLTYSAVRVVLCYVISAKCSRHGSAITELEGFESTKLVFIKKKCSIRTDLYLLFRKYFLAEQQKKACVVK